MNIEFEYVTTDERLFELIEYFETLDAIAVDFEEECNLHIYGEHISIIQIYDRNAFYIVDVLSNDITDRSLASLFAIKTEKIWFECHSDLSILYKKHKVKAVNVFDLRVLSRALGDVHGLDEVVSRFLGVERKENKKTRQQENWMKRPLSPDMLNYALLDVAYLFDLKDALMKEAEEKKKLKMALSAMKDVADVKESKPGWMKICNTKSLSIQERIYLRHIFNARERIAERFNTPSVNVLQKKDVVALAKRCPLKNQEIEEFLSRAPKRYQKLITEAVIKAVESAEREIAGLK